MHPGSPGQLPSSASAGQAIGKPTAAQVFGRHCAAGQSTYVAFAPHVSVKKECLESS